MLNTWLAFSTCLLNIKNIIQSLDWYPKPFIIYPLRNIPPLVTFVPVCDFLEIWSAYSSRPNLILPHPAWNALLCPAWPQPLITSYLLIKSQLRCHLLWKPPWCTCTCTHACAHTHTHPPWTSEAPPWALRTPHQHLCYFTLILFCDDLLCLSTVLHCECSKILDYILFILIPFILGKCLYHIRCKNAFEWSSNFSDTYSLCLNCHLTLWSPILNIIKHLKKDLHNLKWSTHLHSHKHTPL